MLSDFEVGVNIVGFLEKTMFGLLAFTVFLSLTFSVLEGNGSVQTYQKEVSGPYEIGLGTVPPSPYPAVTHFAVYVADSLTGDRYSDVEVNLRGILPAIKRQEIGSQEMQNSLLDPFYYELDVNVQHEGLWQIIVNVSGSDGTAEATFLIEVVARNPLLPIATFGLLLLILMIIGFSVRAWIKQYMKKPRV
tara:strand:- start:1367 stop:1939 length:573 start_codon:yes stop_codon:yes gene_type:complete